MRRREERREEVKKGGEKREERKGKRRGEEQERKREGNEEGYNLFEVFSFQNMRTEPGIFEIFLLSAQPSYVESSMV